MIGWIWRIIVGRFTSPPLCEHKWVTKSKYACSPPWGEGVSSIQYHCQCEKCGEWKEFKL